MSLKTHIRILAMLLMAALATSCADRDTDQPQPEGKTYLTLRIPVTPDPAGREFSNGDGTWGGDYSDTDPGDDFDNRINNVWARIYVNGSPLWTVRLDQIVRNGTYYECSGELPQAPTVTAQAKVMVWANYEPNVAEGTFKSYSRSQIERQGLPMWGVTSGIVLDPGRVMQDVGTIDVLRSMARLEIILDPSLHDQYEIVSATLNTPNVNGYVEPAHFSEVAVTRALAFVPGAASTYCFNPVLSDQTAAGIFWERDLPGGGKDKSMVYFYAPEMQRDATVTLTLRHLTGADAGHNVVYSYQAAADGNPAKGIIFSGPLVRNHLYRVTVNHVGPPEDQHLTFHYHVVPWDQKWADIPPFE